MKDFSLAKLFFCAVAAGVGLLEPCGAHGGGVTLITHGLNGNVNGWITAMAAQIPAYRRFPGTNFTRYEMFFYSSGGSYYLTAARVSGGAPAATDSGEIIVELDWSQLSDGNSYNTYQIAAAVAPALLDTNFIPELGGHALAEMPLHLVGHSRGGSLICQLSLLLGTNGVWVDHLTTLDPHPLNNDGFTLDGFLYSAVDAPAHTYSTVLFHDNYWQDIDFFTHGEAVAGAYVRQLLNLSGGYTGTSGEHSDVHLWYHGTIDWDTPASYNLGGDSASITSAERQAWWTTYEQSGTNAGFEYALIGAGNRLSLNRPVTGTAAVFEGYDQYWDLGGGSSANRTALTTNNGNWPSLIRLNRTDTNAVMQGQNLSAQFYYQWARPAGSNATISVYLDNDFNPFNTNQTLLVQTNVPGTGAGAVGLGTMVIPLAATNASPGWHSIFATIKGGGQTRYLYAPELVQVLSLQQPPALAIGRINSAQFRITVTGLAGQTVILQSSPDLTGWQSIATNTLATGTWSYTNNFVVGPNRVFFRASLAN